MQKRPIGAKRIEVAVAGNPVGGFAFALSGADLLTFAVEDGKASVPEGTSTVAYLSSSGVGVVAKDQLTMSAKDAARGDKGDGTLALAYAAASLYAVRMRADVVLPVLKSLGDVAFIEQFANCFGRQKYSEFTDATKAAAAEKDRRWTLGYDPDRVPPENAFTVLDLLQMLQSDEGNRVLMEHPSFKYSAIGRGRIDASEQLTPEEQAEVERLTAQIAAAGKNTKKVAELTARIASIAANKPKALEFEADPAPDGYPISSLTFNEDRPNVSILVRKPGTVDLSSRVAEELDGQFPGHFPTFIWRNYAIIKDGLVNVDELPVRVTYSTEKILQQYESDGTLPRAAFDDIGCGVVVFHLRKLPVVNRQMVRSVSAAKFFATKYELVQAQAAQKVFNGFTKELLLAKKAEGIAAQYGDEAAAWLKEQGISDGGFSPKTVQAEATDFYMGKCLKVSLKGLSSLPSLKDLREQIKKGKLNAAGKLMKPHFDRVEAFLASDISQSANRDAVLETWLEVQANAARDRARGLIYQIAQTTFCLVVGQVWFSEFSSLDENSMAIDTDEGRVECKAELLETRIKL
jgi:hypothetical protein